jgi:hypothetical protein
LSAVECEWFAVRSLREWLALSLSTRVALVNVSRFATVKTPLAGPFTVAPGAETLKLSTTNRNGDDVTVTLTTGSRTAAQIAVEINSAFGGAGVATADSANRLVFASEDPAVVGTPSIASVGVGTANESLGWAAGGEYDERSAIQAPTFDAIMDGEPLQPDPSLFRPGGLIIMIGDRSSAPRSQNVRDDLYWVDLDLALFFIEPNQQLHRNREAVHACLRAVRECLLTDAGRYAGFAQTTNQAISKVIEKSARIGGSPVMLKGGSLPNALMDVAQLKLGILVFERPDST